MFGIIKLTGKPHEGNPVLSLEGVLSMIGVYKITNTINGKMYIGSSKNIKSRKKDHFKKETSKRFNGRMPLYREMDEYGRENFSFEILEETNLECLADREEYFINKYNSVTDGYNQSCKAEPMQDEKIKSMHGKRLSEWNKRQWQDESYRSKQVERFSKRQKERLKDPEYHAEKSRQLKRYTDSIKKTVYQYDKQGNFIAEYKGTREAERETGVNCQSISKVALGQRKTAGGFVWKYSQEKSVETIESN